MISRANIFPRGKFPIFPNLAKPLRFLTRPRHVRALKGIKFFAARLRLCGDVTSGRYRKQFTTTRLDPAAELTFAKRSTCKRDDAVVVLDRRWSNKRTPIYRVFRDKSRASREERMENAEMRSERFVQEVVVFYSDLISFSPF